MTPDEKRLRHNECVKRWRLNNPLKFKEANKKSRSTPQAKEKHRLEMIQWRKDNPTKTLEINRKSYTANKDKYNEDRRLKYAKDIEYRNKKLEKDREYNSSGKRKLAYNSNPNKSEILKKRWIRIKNGDYEKVREKNRKYRENVLLKKEKIDREDLVDSYVIKIIKSQTKYKIHTKDIPTELIEIKRNTLKLKQFKKQNYDNRNRTNLRNY